MSRLHSIIESAVFNELISQQSVILSGYIILIPGYVIIFFIIWHY